MGAHRNDRARVGTCGRRVLGVLRAFPAADGLSFNDILTTMGFVVFAGAIQIPGIGGGMQIATILVLTEMYGVGVEAASGIALVLWATNFLTALPLGLGMAFMKAYAGVPLGMSVRRTI